MKVFISSKIEGFENHRNAAKQAVILIHFNPIMAEDFPSLRYPPEKACLKEARDSNALFLILGRNYGAKTSSRRSATHEKFLKAKNNNIPTFVFIQKVLMDTEQIKLKKEIVNKIKEAQKHIKSCECIIGINKNKTKDFMGKIWKF